MKLIVSLLLVLFCAQTLAQESTVEITDASKTSQYAKAYSLFKEGKYNATAAELGEVSKQISKDDLKAQGLIAYWRGICFNRAQNFEDAIREFGSALGLEYAPLDIHYEYGQALFAADKLAEARVQFRESLRKKFKQAVSLYYIGYVSNEMGEKKKAVTFYRAIEKIQSDDAMEVRQAAETQIGDIYLEQVEKHPDAFKAVESYVIPQYKQALEIDRQSPLAEQIQEKITELQRKYDLVLFKLRNGRPTLVPPYFARFATEIGMDSNVTFSPTEQEVAESDKQSPFSKTDLIGRYTFYHRDFLSLSPEFRFNYTRYLNRKDTIYRNDNYLMAPALRTAYEHRLWNKPASVLFDYDYSEARRDIDAKEELKFSSRSHTLMIGERFNYFTWGESILRLRHRIFDSYQETSNSTTTSLVFEQIRALKVNTLLFFASYDRTRVENDVYDTDALTLRTDLIMARVRNWFTPSFGFGITRTKPINDSDRGIEYLINPNARLSKTFGKNWRGNLKFDYQDYKSDDEANFAYKKYTYSFELEYLF